MKSTILQKIKNNKPTPLPLPEIQSFPIEADLLQKFCKVSEQGGAKTIIAQHKSLQLIIDECFPSRKKTASTLTDIQTNLDLEKLTPHDLKDIDVCILPTQLGVAENAALYLDEHVMGHRVLPFITQHLVLILEQSNLVGNMHEAYDKIDLKASGFGVFIAGPSKTADIEQALVIGAQGARSLTVVIREDR